MSRQMAWGPNIFDWSWFRPPCSCDPITVRPTDINSSRYLFLDSFQDSFHDLRPRNWALGIVCALNSMMTSMANLLTPHRQSVHTRPRVSNGVALSSFYSSKMGGLWRLDKVQGELVIPLVLTINYFHAWALWKNEKRRLSSELGLRLALLALLVVSLSMGMFKEFRGTTLDMFCTVQGDDLTGKSQTGVLLEI